MRFIRIGKIKYKAPKIPKLYPNCRNFLFCDENSRTKTVCESCGRTTKLGR